MPKGLLRGFLGGVSQGVGEGIGAAGKQYYVNQVMENPNLTPIQKASAVSAYAPEFAKQYLKNAEEQSQLQEFFAGSQQSLASRIPQGQERYAAMQSEVPTAQMPGIGINAPPQAGIPDQSMQQQPQVQGQENAIFSNMSDAKLKEGIARFGKNPALAGALKEELADRRSERKFQQRNMQEEKKFLFDVHKSTAKLDEKIQAKGESSRDRLRSFGTMKRALNTGNINPKSFENLATTALKGTAWENFFKNKDRAAFEAASLSSYDGMKEKFGTRLSDADLKLASGKVPDATKSKEANLAIIDYMEFQDRMNLAEEKIGAEIKKENGGFRPIDYADQIRARMEEEFGDEAEEITARAAHEGEAIPEPNEMDPLMTSVYGEVAPDMARLTKGSEVIDIPVALINSAVKDGYKLLEKGA